MGSFAGIDLFDKYCRTTDIANDKLPDPTVFEKMEL